jgi:hypothetical protein
MVMYYLHKEDHENGHDQMRHVQVDMVHYLLLLDHHYSMEFVDDSTEVRLKNISQLVPWASYLSLTSTENDLQ